MRSLKVKDLSHPCRPQLLTVKSQMQRRYGVVERVQDREKENRGGNATSGGTTRPARSGSCRAELPCMYVPYFANPLCRPRPPDKIRKSVVTKVPIIRSLLEADSTAGSEGRSVLVQCPRQGLLQYHSNVGIYRYFFSKSASPSRLHGA